MHVKLNHRSHRGTILPLLAVTCFALFGFVALAVDLGMLMVARSECQNAADSAALTAARVLDNDIPQGGTQTSYDNKRLEAVAAAKGGGTPSPANTSNLYAAGVKGNVLMNANFSFSDSAVDKVEIGIYDYDASVTQTFQPKFPATGADPATKLNGYDGTVRPWTAARVTVKGDQPTYFARIFGVSTMPMSATAVAVHRPRDIAMVLDFSGSMQFGSRASFPPGSGSSNGAVQGLLNPDTRYPRFGHFARYDSGRQTTNPNNANAHPFMTTGGYVSGSGEFFSPNNHTVESTGGPPMVNDFYYYTSNSVPVANPANLRPAFNNTLPNGNSAMQVCPLSNNYAQQDIAVGTFVGDRSPRKGGVRLANTTTWDNANSQGAAKNVRELLFGNDTGTLSSAAGRTIPAGRNVIAANNSNREGGDVWRNFYDNAWETRGYDLDIPAYISGGYATEAYRNSSTEPFCGYTLAPGYWGKSFFTWPPDPRFDSAANLTAPNTGTTRGTTPAFDTSGRAMCDWRRRFFLKSDSTAFNPQVDNVNGLLLRSTAGGHTLNTTTPTDNNNSTTTTFRVNYAAVLAWLKTGPQTLPPNLRAGRILYYDAIPNNCATPANDNERFWREYIDFVLGVSVNRTWYNPAFCLAGVENSPWMTVSLTSTTAFTPTNKPQNPKPYMTYTDVPNMPRAHFWFGPASMIMFLSTRGGFTGSSEHNWMAGTVREAQSWQLKAAIQSGISDVQKNHPNDQMGMAFFAYSNFRTPRVGMGQQWDRLKAALFYPKDTVVANNDGLFLNDVLATTYNSREERPYNSSMGARLTGNLPNSNGATDPNNGLAQAYNMFSPLSSGASGAGGRRGAAKIVIFETDGVPNSYQNWDFVSNGVNSKYNWVDAGSSPGNGNSTAMQEAYDVTSQITASTTAGAPGFSLPNAPARVYSIAFGDLFSSSSTFLPTAQTFLQTIQYRGNALASTATPLPAEQIITGNYTTRITNLRVCLERIFQNGVQVALIE